ncbi:hypothetical protein ACFO5O_05095 [Geojedonia litorea]|uniref:Cation efflux family protein n=1 Tax=Geojedonia litorea TaxID=1268269 RepID=A0ABV9N092_9FLAO
MNYQTNSKTDKLYKTAFALALFSIGYNIAEGLISTYLGFEDESLALFGFGSDSFIKVISGFGITYFAFKEGKECFERSRTMHIAVVINF